MNRHCLMHKYPLQNSSRYSGLQHQIKNQIIYFGYLDIFRGLKDQYHCPEQVHPEWDYSRPNYTEWHCWTSIELTMMNYEDDNDDDCDDDNNDGEANDNVDDNGVSLSHALSLSMSLSQPNCLFACLPQVNKGGPSICGWDVQGCGRYRGLNATQVRMSVPTKVCRLYKLHERSQPLT